MFDFTKKIFIGFLTSILNASNRTKRVSLSNQKFTTQPIIDLHPNKSLEDCVTIHLSLTYIDVQKIVILLMTYLIKYVFQTKQKI